MAGKTDLFKDIDRPLSDKELGLEDLDDDFDGEFDDEDDEDNKPAAKPGKAEKPAAEAAPEDEDTRTDEEVEAEAVAAAAKLAEEEKAKAAAAVKPDADAKPAKGKAAPVAYDRFAEVIKERNAAAEKAARLEKALEEATKPKAAASTFDFKAKEREAAKLLVENDIDGYLAMRGEIDDERERMRETVSAERTAKLVADARAEAKRESEEALWDAKADEIADKYPLLDTRGGDGFDQKAVDEVRKYQQYLMSQGMAGHRALEEAADTIMLKYGAAKTSAAPVEKPMSAAEKRNKEALAKAIAANNAQPPSTSAAGSGGRELSPERSFGKLGVLEVENLSPALKKEYDAWLAKLG